MNWAEVGATGAYNNPGNHALASGFRARFTGTAVSAMMFLEFALLSFNISIVGHRVAAEIYAFFQNLFHGSKHQFKLFVWNGFRDRKRVYTSAPKDLV